MIEYMIKVLVVLTCFGNALIIPNELPSIVSLISSIVPQVKKGTDSRLGFGFRLGDHADIQVLFELGPQTNTQQIGTTDSINTFKREIITKHIENNPNDASKWLKNWYKDTNGKKSNIVQDSSSKNPKEMNSIKTMEMISPNSLSQLRQLYKWTEKDIKSEIITTTTEPLVMSKKSLLEIITPRN